MHCVFMCVHVFVSVPCNLRLPSNLIVSFLSFKEFESEFRTDGVGEGVVSLGSRWSYAPEAWIPWVSFFVMVSCLRGRVEEGEEDEDEVVELSEVSSGIVVILFCDSDN